MKLPAYYTTKKYPLYELIGLGIILIKLIVVLTQQYIRYDWVTDTLWLGSGILLAWSEWQKENPITKLPPALSNSAVQLLFGLYLFLYHLLASFLTLNYGGINFLLYLCAGVLYTIALYLRAKDAGINLKLFNWKNLLRYPAWPLTVALAICLFSMFLPFVKATRLSTYYGMQYGYNSYSGWGYNNWGYNLYNTTVLLKGYWAPWGTVICLILLFLIVFHILKIAGGHVYAKLELVFKIGVAALAAWWLIGAKGYESLKGFGNILFILGLLLAAFAIYLPDKLGELIKRKGIIK